jgi:hypothetical protein
MTVELDSTLAPLHMRAAARFGAILQGFKEHRIPDEKLVESLLEAADELRDVKAREDFHNLSFWADAPVITAEVPRPMTVAAKTPAARHPGPSKVLWTDMLANDQNSDIRLLEMEVDTLCNYNVGMTLQFWSDIKVYDLNEALVYLRGMLGSHPVSDGGTPDLSSLKVSVEHFGGRLPQ